MTVLFLDELEEKKN